MSGLRKTWLRFLAWASFGLGVFSPAMAFGQEGDQAMYLIRPEEVKIDWFFHGQNITFEAITPFQSTLVLRILGPKEDVVLMKKERIGGLWMNGEEIKFENIPSTILLWTTAIPSAQSESSFLREMKLDYSSLLSDSLPGRPPQEKRVLIEELIKLKEHDKIYQIHEGAIHVVPFKKGVSDKSEVVLHLPAKIAPGIYNVELIAFKDGKSTVLCCHTLVVKLTGLPAFIASLARQNGLLYGLYAVFIATLSGLGIGVFFRSKSHH
jgi:uncharacterized protein (TIGR02186 family)